MPWPKSPIDPDLTIKQQRWVEAYLETGNATEAARQAGYNATEATLRVIGSQNLTKHNIRARIRERLEDEAVSATEILNTLASHVRSDITDLFDETGIIDLQTIREQGLGHLIKKIKRKRRYERDGEEMVPVDELEIEVHNPQTAAAQICKMMGWEQMPAINDRDRQAAEDVLDHFIQEVEQTEGRILNRQEALAYAKELGIPSYDRISQALASTAVQ